MRREPFRVITIAFGPLCAAPLEREDSQLTREMRSRVGDTAGDERGRHGGRETDALEGVALLEFGAGCHGCFEAGAEFAVRLVADPQPVVVYGDLLVPVHDLLAQIRSVCAAGGQLSIRPRARQRSGPPAPGRAVLHSGGTRRRTSGRDRATSAPSPSRGVLHGAGGQVRRGYPRHHPCQVAVYAVGFTAYLVGDVAALGDEAAEDGGFLEHGAVCFL